MPDFVLYSKKHTRPGHPFVFWGPNRNGYVASLGSAGRYTAEEAAQIVRNREDTVEIPVSELGRFSVRECIDPDWKGNDAVLKDMIDEATFRDLSTWSKSVEIPADREIRGPEFEAAYVVEFEVEDQGITREEVRTVRMEMDIEPRDQQDFMDAAQAFLKTFFHHPDRDVRVHATFCDSRP